MISASQIHVLISTTGLSLWAGVSSLPEASGAIDSHPAIAALELVLRWTQDTFTLTTVHTQVQHSSCFLKLCDYLMSQFLVIMNLKWVCKEDVKRKVISTNDLNG